MMRAVHSRAARRGRTGPVRFGRSVAALALSLGGLVLAAAFVGITVQGNALARDITALHADIAAAQADQLQLKQRIADQQTSDYVIDRARDFGYIRPNESLYGVERNGQGSAQSVASAKAGPTRIERWIAFFFGSH